MIESQLCLFLLIFLFSMLSVQGSTDIAVDIDSEKRSNKAAIKVNSHGTVTVFLLLQCDKRHPSTNFILTLQDAPYDSRYAKKYGTKIPVLAQKSVTLEWEEETKRQHDLTTKSWRGSALVTFLVPHSLLTVDGSNPYYRDWRRKKEIRSVLLPPPLTDGDAFTSPFSETSRTLIVTLFEQQPFNDPVLLTRRFTTIPLLSPRSTSSMALEEKLQSRQRDALKPVAHIEMHHVFASCQLRRLLGAEAHFQIEGIQNTSFFHDDKDTSSRTMLQMKLAVSLLVLAFLRLKALAKFRQLSAGTEASACGAREDGLASQKTHNQGCDLTERGDEAERDLLSHASRNKKRKEVCFSSSRDVSDLQKFLTPVRSGGIQNEENTDLNFEVIIPREKTKTVTAAESNDQLRKETAAMKEYTEDCSTVSGRIGYMRAHCNSQLHPEQHGTVSAASRGFHATEMISAGMEGQAKGQVQTQRKADGQILCQADTTVNNGNVCCSSGYKVSRKSKFLSSDSYLSKISAQSQCQSDNSDSRSREDIVVDSEKQIENSDHSGFFFTGTLKRAAVDACDSQLETSTAKEPSFLISARRSKKPRNVSTDLPHIVVDALEQGNVPKEMYHGRKSPNRKVRPYATSQILPDWVPSRGLQSVSRSFMEDSPWTLRCPSGCA